MTLPRKILIGERVGRWLIISYAGRDERGSHLWDCLCDCGIKRPVRHVDLTRSRSLSCGCLRRDNTKKANTRHGACRTLEYRIWSNMLNRCRNANDFSFRFYGARGIRVCERWLDFRNFLGDMGFCPPKMSIERKNNSGNYEPGNCIWADKATQSRNRRSTKWVFLYGEMMPISEAALKLGINRHTLRRYEIVHGFSPQQAVDHALPRKKRSA